MTDCLRTGEEHECTMELIFSNRTRETAKRSVILYKRATVVLMPGVRPDCAIRPTANLQ